MYFFKKMSLIVVLGIGCFSLSAQAADKHIQNMAYIFKVLGQSLEAELGRIEASLANSQEIDFAVLQEAVAKELPAMKSKFTDAVKRELTQEQRDVLVNALRKWKDMSAFTSDELLVIGQTALKNMALFDREFKKHFPKPPMVDKDMISFIDELKKADFGSSEFNLLNRFMCDCGYINFDKTLKPLNDPDDNRLLLDELSGDKQALFIHRACEQMVGSAAILFVFVNDSYFFPNWQQKFENSGKIFAIVHNVCTQLLAAIE